MMNMWRVVHFLKEDTVEAVPSSWLRGCSECYWPPFTGMKLKAAIAKCTPPTSNWDVHEARIIGNLYGDLSVARVKAIDAERVSDLNSDSESLQFGLGHRKIHMNKKYVDDDTDQEKDDDDAPSPEQSEILMMPFFKKGEETNPHSGVNTTVEQKKTQLSSVPLSGASCSNTTDEQFKRQVLRNLSILNFKLDQLTEDISRITTKKSEEDLSVPSIFQKFNFPLSEEEELQKLESFLADGEKYNQVQMELARIGGSNAKIMVKRILDKILSNKLGMTYSWIGFKRKNFSVLLTAKVLIDAVMTSQKKASAAEVEASAKQWLVKCKAREEKENN